MKTHVTRICRLPAQPVTKFWWRRFGAILFIYISFAAVTFAQNKVWDKTLGGNQFDHLNSAQQTSDGGYILGGTSRSGISGDKSQVGRGETDYWVIKLNADGTKAWDKTFGGNNTDLLRSVQQTSDGGYILGGTSDSGIGGDKTEASRNTSEDPYGKEDYWVVKLNADGTKAWDKTIGGDEEDELTSLQQTSDGGYILGGYSFSGISGDKTTASKGGTDYWIVKLSAGGTKVWDKTLGGDGSDRLISLQQTSDGGYILGGNSASGINGDKTEASRDADDYYIGDYWIVKLTADGSKVWDKTIGGNLIDEFASIRQTSDGGYLLGGSSMSDKSGDKSEDNKGVFDFDKERETYDYWVVKLKADGTKVWDKTISGEQDDFLSSVQQTNDGGYILGGSSNSRIYGSVDKTENPKGGTDYWVVKLKADGSKVWDKTIGGDNDDELSSLLQTSDGNYLLGGTSDSDISDNKSEASKGNQDYWIVKLDNSGVTLSQTITFKSIPNKIFGDAPYSLSATASSGLPVSFSVVSGPATVSGTTITLTDVGTVTVKATQAGNATYQSTEVTRSFLVRPDIKQPWDKTFGGTNLDKLTAMASSPDGGYLLGGSSSSGISGNKSQAGKGGPDYWIVKTDHAGNKLWDKTFGGNHADNLTAILATTDGGYLLGGSSYSGISGDKSQPGKGKADYWVIKIDENGNKLWDQVYGGANTDSLTVIITAPAGGYLLGGSSASNSSGDKTGATKGALDYWVVKLDATGKKIWDKTYGGSNADKLAAIISAADGGYLVGGSSASGISGDKSQASRGLEDYWVLRIKEDGTRLWDKTFGGIKEYGDASCNEVGADCTYFGSSILSSLATTPDGGFLLGGSSNAAKGAEKSENNISWDYFLDTDAYLNDYWIVKIDSKGNKVWDNTYGGISVYIDDDNLGEDLYTGNSELKSILTTPDGGYLLAGTSDSSVGEDKSESSRGDNGILFEGPQRDDYWLVKIDGNGQKKWDKTIGGTYNDNLAAILPGGEGEYVLGGSSVSEKGGDKSEAGWNTSEYYLERSDYWIVKLKDETPSPVATAWNMRYGGAGTDNFTVAIKTSDGGYLSGGYTNSGNSGDKTQNSQGQNDYWIVKSDRNGKKVWDKRYGGSGHDYLNRVIQTADGGYLLGGSSLSGNSSDKSQTSRGDRDYWVVKVDALGTKQWDKRFGGSGYDELEKVIQLATGEYVLGGYSNSPASGDKTQASQGGNDYWLVKISATGTKLWDKRYGGANNETLGSFTEAKDGGFLLGGTSFSKSGGDKSQANRGDSDYWVVKTDKEGNLLWDKTYGGSGQDEAYSVGRSGNNFFISGTSNSGISGEKSQNSQGGKDYWLVKINSTGTKLWDKRFGGSNNDELRASTAANDGGYVLAGQSFSGASGDKTQSNQGGSDYWVVQVDKDGQKVSDQRYGGSGTEELRTVFKTADGGLLLGGRSDSGVSGDRSQPSQGSTDYWLVKVAPETTSIIAAREATVAEEPARVELVSLNAYPNPFSERATISFTLPETQTATVKVYDNQGREVATLFQGEAKAKQVYQLEWKANNQAAGMYLLQLQTTTKRRQHKLLVAK